MKTIGTRATWAARIAGYAFFLALGWFAAAAVSADAMETELADDPKSDDY